MQKKNISSNFVCRMTKSFTSKAANTKLISILKIFLHGVQRSAAFPLMPSSRTSLHTISNFSFNSKFVKRVVA